MTRYYTGNGQDGALVVSSAVSEDSVKTQITGVSNIGDSTITVNSTTGFLVYDFALVMQMTGTGAGNYEVVEIISTVGGVLTLNTSLINAYGATGAQVIKIRQYSSINVNNGGTWKASIFDGTNYIGGVLVAMVSGDVNVNSGGFVDLRSMGWSGGAGATFAGPGAQKGNGPGGGNPGSGGSFSGAGGGGAGHATTGSVGSQYSGGSPGSGGSSYDSANLQSGNMQLGSGGGGSFSPFTVSGQRENTPGGNGGGILILIVKGNITISGSGIICDGTGNPGSDAVGGGGSGGSIRFITIGTITFNSSVSAQGVSVNADGSGANGGRGSDGFIAALSGTSIIGSTMPTIDTSSTDTTFIPTYSINVSDTITTNEYFDTHPFAIIYESLSISEGIFQYIVKPTQNPFTGTWGSTLAWGSVGFSIAPYASPTYPTVVGSAVSSAGTTGSYNTFTLTNLTVPSGSNEVIVLFAVDRLGAPATATFGGSNIPLVYLGEMGALFGVNVLYLVNPPQITGNIIINWSFFTDHVGAGAFVVQDAAQNLPLSNLISATGYDTHGSLLVSPNTNYSLLANIMMTDPTTISPGQTQRFLLTLNGGYQALASTQNGANIYDEVSVSDTINTTEIINYFFQYQLITVHETLTTTEALTTAMGAYGAENIHLSESVGLTITNPLTSRLDQITLTESITMFIYFIFPDQPSVKNDLFLFDNVTVNTLPLPITIIENMTINESFVMNKYSFSYTRVPPGSNGGGFDPLEGSRGRSL